MQKYYAVGTLERTVDLTINGNEITTILSWGDGMIGVIPVFRDEESAKQYANGKHVVYAIQTEV